MIPALLSKISTLGYFYLNLSTKDLIELKSFKSRGMNSTLAFLFYNIIFFTASFPLFVSRHAKITLRAPRFENSWAHSNPRPVLDPVTITIDSGMRGLY